MTVPTVGSAPGRPRPPRRRARPTALTWFLGVLLVFFAAYTQLALGMEWRTEAGRIGAGFFPRVIGILGIVLCGAAAVRSLRPVRPAEPDGRPAGAVGGQPSDDKYPLVLAGSVGLLAALTFLLVPLGAVVASALFIFAVARLLGRGRLRNAIALSVLLPLAMYLLLDVLLNSGLPDGVLPLP